MARIGTVEAAVPAAIVGFAGDTPATTAKTAKRKNSAASDGGSYSDWTKATSSPLAISRALRLPHSTHPTDATMTTPRISEIPIGFSFAVTQHTDHNFIQGGS